MPSRTISRLSILAGLVLALVGCGSGDQEQGAVDRGAPVPVSTVTVRKAVVPLTRSVIGSVTPLRTASLGTKIMGRIDRVTVDEGDRVKAGSLLVQVDVADVSAKKAQAEAALKEAQAMLRNAEAQFDRIKALFERGSATRKEYDDVEAAVLAARARVSAAESMRREADVTEAYGRIKAPFSGVVTGKLVEEGDMTAPGQPLVVLEDQSKVKIAVSVPERDIASVRVGTPLEFVVDAASEKARTGEVQEIVPSADRMSRTFEVRIVVDNADGALRPGMFARVTIPVGSQESILIPQESVHRKGQLEGVFIVDDGAVRLSWIKTGRAHGLSVEVISGLEEGDRIVVRSDAPLRDGQPVRGTEVAS